MSVCGCVYVCVCGCVYVIEKKQFVCGYVCLGVCMWSCVCDFFVKEVLTVTKFK